MRTLTSLAASCYLLVQLLVPLLVIVRDELTSRDFAWDMFSYHLSCNKLGVILGTGRGDWESVRLERDFGSWAQLRRALSAQRFSDYAGVVCQRERERRGQPVQLYVTSECVSDREQPPFALLDPERDFCSPH